MSMLRNVLTYMGLGPDEDYEEGYLRDGDDIDLTDEAPARRPAEHDDFGDELDEEPADDSAAQSRNTRAGSRDRDRAGGRSRDAGRTSRASGPINNRSDAPSRAAAGGSDPHAQRERPGWLAAPTSAARQRSTAVPAADLTGDDEFDGNAAPDVDDREALDARSDEDRRRRGAHDVLGRGRGAHDLIEESEAVRPLRAVPPRSAEEPSGEGDRTREAALNEPSVEPEIRLVPPRILAPRSFGDAKELADEFKAIVPVVMDLQGVDRELARRLIDFASGICYAMDGSMEKVASQVFLLVPVGVEVSDDERRRLEKRRPTDRS